MKKMMYKRIIQENATHFMTNKQQDEQQQIMYSTRVTVPVSNFTLFYDTNDVINTKIVNY